MNLKQTLKMALKSIQDAKMRAFLTTLGIIVGVASVITLVSIVNGFQNDLLKQFEAWGTNTVNAQYYGEKVGFMDEFLEYSEKELSEYVVAISSDVSDYTTLKFKTKKLESSIYFADEYYSKVNDKTVVNGRDITYADIKNYSKVIVIGDAVKKELFPAINPIGQSIKIKGNDYKIVGVYQGKFGGEKYSPDNSSSIPSSLQKKITGSKDIKRYSVKTLDGEATKAYTKKIKQHIKTMDFGVSSNDESIEQVKQISAQMSAIAGAIASVSLIVGGIGIMNIMFVTVTERTREIGIRMAIGAKRKDIVLQFLIEAGTISAFGGVIGIAIGTLLSVLGSSLFLKEIYYPGIGLVLGSFAFSAGIGVVFGIFPANKASKLQPVDALRTQ